MDGSDDELIKTPSKYSVVYSTPHEVPNAPRKRKRANNDSSSDLDDDNDRSREYVVNSDDLSKITVTIQQPARPTKRRLTDAEWDARAETLAPSSQKAAVHDVIERVEDALGLLRRIYGLMPDFESSADDY